MLGKGTGGHGNKTIITIGHKTKKNPWDLRRLALTQTPVRDYQLTLVRKTLWGVKY